MIFKHHLMIHVSVIVPIYNVGRYIGRCAESLLGQTMKSGIEFIFVNDATQDDSMEVLRQVLRRHPERAGQVRILEHDRNKGLPAARNTGMDTASGEYIYHCDSDDFLEKSMLLKMHTRAQHDNADIVWCDWYLSFRKKERYMRQPQFQTPFSALRAMLDGSMKYNVWNKLVRRNLYESTGIRFPEGHSMGEDMTMIKLMACSFKESHVPEALYHYVKSDVAMSTGTLSRKALEDLKFNAEDTIAFLRKEFQAGLKEGIALFKTNVKLPFLLTGSHDDYLRWCSWYPEADSYIWRNKKASLRIKLLQQCAALRIYPAVWIYFHMIQKVIYGLIYR